MSKNDQSQTNLEEDLIKRKWRLLGYDV